MSSRASRPSSRRPGSPLLPEDSYPNIQQPKEGHTSVLMAFLSVLLVLGFGFWAALGSLAGTSEGQPSDPGSTPTAAATQMGAPIPPIAPAKSEATAAPAPAPTEPSATSEPGDSRVHVVGQGDTLYRISQQYDTTIEAIMEANDITDRGHILHIGDRLTIP